MDRRSYRWYRELPAGKSAFLRHRGLCKGRRDQTWRDFQSSDGRTLFCFQNQGALVYGWIIHVLETRLPLPSCRRPGYWDELLRRQYDRNPWCRGCKSLLPAGHVRWPRVLAPLQIQPKQGPCRPSSGHDEIGVSSISLLSSLARDTARGVASVTYEHRYPRPQVRSRIRNGPIENRASSKAKVKLRPVVVTTSKPSARYCPDTISPVAGSRRTAGFSPPGDVKSNMSMIDPEVASKEPSPSRSPPNQLSSMKRITEAWSIWA
jgi:hypothetical protein